jgi:FtsZ-binding cell division protein ZapB
MFYKAQKRTNYWSKIRKKAPKVPDITCPAIDEVITKIEKLVGKNLNKTQFKLIEKKMERLRRANEQLRDSGVYWHDTCKETVRDLLGKKKSR